jgi:pSer/pThr/pTyr-binding forkhead associated (FHA) protein
MSWLKRIFDSRHRRARAAEGAGQWRRAAALWAEADEPERVAAALMHLAERARELEDRLEAWHDALRWIPEDDDERRSEVERKMALAVLEDARHRGAASTEEKRRLSRAAEQLERLERPAWAAEAWEILGRTEDQARALEAAGEVEKLEELLERTSAADQRERRLRRLLSDYEMALRYGARLEARSALREALRVAPDERSVAELLRRLEARLPPPSSVRLAVDGRRVRFVGRLPAVLGRGDVDVPIRGTSVSRRHAEIARRDGTLVIRDLDSRNGTLIRGLPIRGAIELSGETEVGLGDAVTLRVRPAGARGVVLEVLGGFDRGEHVVVGEGDLRFAELAAAVRFEDGWAVLDADPGVELTLGEQPCALPVHLLLEDRLVVGDVPVEVLE